MKPEQSYQVTKKVYAILREKNRKKMGKCNTERKNKAHSDDTLWQDVSG